jgi:UDP-glucuronate decarboxylase
MTNFVGTMNLCKLALRNNARLLLASTSEVYGDPLVHPQPESYYGNVSTTGPRACYDEGKRSAEALCMAFHRKHELQVRIARIFNTYGPRMALDDGRVVSNFIVQCMQGAPLTVYGDGEQTRSFCYVSDLVIGLSKLMESDCCDPINLGNPSEFTISELGSRISSLVGCNNPEVHHRDLPQDDPVRRKPEISRARDVLGWEPHVPLLEGLKLTIEDFRERFAKIVR